MEQRTHGTHLAGQGEQEAIAGTKAGPAAHHTSQLLARIRCHGAVAVLELRV